jgi:hypothetical protein
MDSVVSPSQEAGPSRSPRRSNSILSGAAGGPSPLDPSTSQHHPDGIDDPNDPNRNKPRTARACSSCNKQKLRCDGRRPCSRCVGLGIQGECEYLPSLRGKTRKRKADRDKDKDKDKSQTQTTNVGLGRGSNNDVILEGKSREPESFDMWQRDNALASTLARNSTLWADDRRPISPRRPSTGNVPAINPSPRIGLDNLTTTTLPLPGDAHNPLAVLAEASSTSNPFGPISPANGYQGREGEDKGYYAPLERVLKDEAPHIMSRIDVHE